MNNGLSSKLSYEALKIWEDEVVPFCLKHEPDHGVSSGLVIGWLIEELVKLRRETRTTFKFPTSYKPSDPVELRKLADRLDPTEPTDAVCADSLRQAADEIERLRERERLLNAVYHWAAVETNESTGLLTQLYDAVDALRAFDERKRRD